MKELLNNSKVLKMDTTQVSKQLIGLMEGSVDPYEANIMRTTSHQDTLEGKESTDKQAGLSKIVMKFKNQEPK